MRRDYTSVSSRTRRCTPKRYSRWVGIWPKRRIGCCRDNRTIVSRRVRPNQRRPTQPSNGRERAVGVRRPAGRTRPETRPVLALPVHAGARQQIRVFQHRLFRQRTGKRDRPMAHRGRSVNAKPTCGATILQKSRANSMVSGERPEGDRIGDRERDQRRAVFAGKGSVLPCSVGGQVE